VAADLPTPLDQAPDALAPGRSLFLKREDVHELGAFKWRGAVRALAAYRDGAARGVVTASTGNHAAATAWAAQRMGLAAVVFVPQAVSGAKLRTLEALGADIRQVGADLDEAKDAARAHAAAAGLAFFEDGAEPAQFEGYAAIAREVVEQLGEPPARMVVPLGNGALLIGIARVLRGHTVGVVAKEAPVMALSVAAGRPVPCDRCATFADGMAVRVAIPLATEELVRLAVPLVQVSERAIARAVGALAAAGVRVEGSAAAPLAALEQLEPVAGPEVLLVSGRNIDDELHRRAVEEPGSFPD
jgi:threonine dehydratase